MIKKWKNEKNKIDKINDKWINKKVKNVCVKVKWAIPGIRDRKQERKVINEIVRIFQMYRASWKFKCEK